MPNLVSSQPLSETTTHSAHELARRPWLAFSTVRHTYHSAVQAFEAAVEAYETQGQLSPGEALYVAMERAYPSIAAQIPDVSDLVLFEIHLESRVESMAGCKAPQFFPSHRHTAASAIECLHDAIRKNLANPKLAKGPEHDERTEKCAVHGALDWARSMLAKDFENTDELELFLNHVNGIELHFPVKNGDSRAVNRRLRENRERLQRLPTKAMGSRDMTPVQWDAEQLRIDTMRACMEVRIAADERLHEAYEPLRRAARKEAEIQRYGHVLNEA